MPVLLYWIKLLQICFLQDRRTEFYTNCLDWTDSEGEKAKVQFRVLQSSSREREYSGNLRQQTLRRRGVRKGLS